MHSCGPSVCIVSVDSELTKDLWTGMNIYHHCVLWCDVSLDTSMVKHKTAEGVEEAYKKKNIQTNKQTKYTCNMTLLFTAQYSGDLRLVQNGFTNSSNTSGRLEIYHRGLWKSMCDYTWSTANTRVACRQLGFSTSNTSWSTSSNEGWGVCVQYCYLQDDVPSSMLW